MFIFALFSCTNLENNSEDNKNGDSVLSRLEFCGNSCMNKPEALEQSTQTSEVRSRSLEENSNNSPEIGVERESNEIPLAAAAKVEPNENSKKSSGKEIKNFSSCSKTFV